MMRIALRDIEAKCSHCGLVEFTPRDAADASVRAVFVCDGCGTEHTRFELFMRVAEDALLRAANFVEHMRKARNARAGRK